MHSPSNVIRILGAGCLMLAFCWPPNSQTTTGRILGRVSDPSGAAVAGATVTITDTQRGTTRIGHRCLRRLRRSELQPGAYKVRAEARGFKTVERVNIVLEVAQDLRADVRFPRVRSPKL